MNRNNIIIVTKEIFEISLITYLILIVIETFRPGFASNFFNINYLLIPILGAGLALALTPQKERKNTEIQIDWKITKVRNIRKKKIVVADIIKPKKLMYQ